MNNTLNTDGKYILKPSENRISAEFVLNKKEAKPVDPTLDKFVLTMEDGRWSVNYKSSTQLPHVGFSDAKMNEYLSNPDNYMRRN